MYNRFYLLGLVVLLGIGGCSSDGDERRQEYLDADYYTRLELPPDLTAPEDSRQLVSPKPSHEAVKKFKEDSAHLGEISSDDEVESIPVGIKVEGARIRSGDGVFWLEVDESSDKLWPQLSAFWSHEGIKVTRNEPMLGTLETDWVSKLQVDKDAGFFTSLFSKVDPDKLDKFKMRIEPVEGADKTKIFMSHSGLEMFVQGEDLNWRTRCSEEELEREMLTRLSLFVGLNKEQAEKAFANYRPYASRVRIPEDVINTLYVTGTLNFVWKRTLRALDRMGVDVLEMDAPNNKIKLAIERISDEQLGVDEDELAKSSWIMQLFSKSSDTYKEDSDRQFIIKLIRSDGIVKLEIFNADEEVSETVLAEQFRKNLAIELQ